MTDRIVSLVLVCVLFVTGFLVEPRTVWAHDEGSPSAAPEAFDITIPAGWRLEQIAEEYARLGGAGGGQAFLDAVNGLDRSQFEFLADLPAEASLEGYLFPDTYRFDANDPTLNVVTMLTNFGTKYTPEMRRRTQQRGLTIHDVVTLASIIEREAPIAAERPTIADVYLSRWAQNWPLEAASTVQYALGIPQNWWPVFTGDDRFSDSPYNTHQHAGLPPGPIANPGLVSIQAVLFPDDTPYLYLVAKGKTGEHAFAVTPEEHWENVMRYAISDDPNSDPSLGTPVPSGQGVAFDAEALRTCLGPGWVIVSGFAEVADADDRAITGILGNTRVRYGGPAGARVGIWVFPLPADPAASATAWRWASEENFDVYAERDLDHEPNAEELAAQAPVPVGCDEARRLEGTGQLDWDFRVGMTLCAVGTEEIILVLTSGKVLGEEGVAASDRVAARVAADLRAAPIVATHRVWPEIPSVNLRAEPSRTAAIVAEVAAGTALRWLGDEAPATDPTDGPFWLKVRTADGDEGWIRGIDLVLHPNFR